MRQIGSENTSISGTTGKNGNARILMYKYSLFMLPTIIKPSNLRKTMNMKEKVVFLFSGHDVKVVVGYILLRNKNMLLTQIRGMSMPCEVWVKAIPQPKDFVP